MATVTAAVRALDGFGRVSIGRLDTNVRAILAQQIRVSRWATDPVGRKAMQGASGTRMQLVQLISEGSRTRVGFAARIRMLSRPTERV